MRREEKHADDSGSSLLLNVSSACLTIWVMFPLTPRQCQAAPWTVSMHRLPPSICVEGQLPILARSNLFIFASPACQANRFLFFFLSWTPAQELKMEKPIGKKTSGVRKTLPRYTAVISPLSWGAREW